MRFGPPCSRWGPVKDEGKVDIPEVDFLAVKRVDDPYVDIRMCGPEPAQSRDQPAHGHRRDCCNNKGAAGPEVACPAASCVDCIERERKGACKLLGVGEGAQSVAVPDEEGFPEPILKRSDLVTYRALRHEQIVSRSAERSTPNDCLEGTQRIEWRKSRHLQAT